MTFSDGTVPPDRGISSSQAVNLNEVNEVGFPNGIYSLESNSFSLKKKIEEVDNICSRLVKEI